ncbi:hypothetical protein J1C67_14985 [Clostridium gasigenes]|uniref:hypothetical protein n=1 Tax=Clostridium gasigenes TaxID=94869 RepID=UPI001438595E|nr:hypothetical protein [Clostridium gasigenes]NKF05388.1 hypothetical protein [Clostridium gasigenes]QSW18836.1 hypothetical protein J1C67_14985 [Clostridium gasigenes]
MDKKSIFYPFYVLEWVLSEMLALPLKEIDENNKEEIKAIKKAHKEELNAIETEEISKLKKELTKQFKEELDNKLEVEKSKYQLELDKAINKEQLLQEKYNTLEMKLENIKPINN